MSDFSDMAGTIEEALDLADRYQGNMETISRLQAALQTVLDLTMAIEQSQETRLHDIYDVAAAALPTQQDDDLGA